jgi:hypothetical protein
MRTYRACLVDYRDPGSTLVLHRCGQRERCAQAATMTLRSVAILHRVGGLDAEYDIPAFS